MIDCRPALFIWLVISVAGLLGIWYFVEKPWQDAEANYASIKLEQEHAAFMRGCVPTTSEARCNELWRWTAPVKGQP